jgi:hypothetical protein
MMTWDKNLLVNNYRGITKNSHLMNIYQGKIRIKILKMMILY